MSVSVSTCIPQFHSELKATPSLVELGEDDGGYLLLTPPTFGSWSVAVIIPWPSFFLFFLFSFLDPSSISGRWGRLPWRPVLARCHYSGRGGPPGQRATLNHWLGPSLNGPCSVLSAARAVCLWALQTAGLSVLSVSADQRNRTTDRSEEKTKETLDATWTRFVMEAKLLQGIFQQLATQPFTHTKTIKQRKRQPVCRSCVHSWPTYPTNVFV